MGPRLIDPIDALPEPAQPPVRAYLALLTAELPPLRSPLAAIREELVSGLVDDIEARIRDGMAPEPAARYSVREFGDPRLLARQFTLGLSLVTARRIGLSLVGTGPVVGFLWLTAMAGRAGQGWWDQLNLLPSTHPSLMIVLAATVLSAIVGVLAGSARLPLGPHGAVTAALVAAVGCIVTDTTLLMGTLSSIGSAWSMVAALACTVSAVRLSAAVAAARRCAALRTSAV